MVRVAAVLCMLLTGGLSMATAGSFEDLGVPCVRACALSRMVGPDETGQMNRVYLGFNQDGGPLFLTQVDPATNEAKQFSAPEGCGGPWALATGKDGKVYVGTCEGGSHQATVLQFDPRRPAEGLRVVGRPAASETYIWQYAVGSDGRLYGCTYPGAKLVSYDPATGKLADCGRMDDGEKYARLIAAGDDGWVYTGIGMVRANLVGYNTATGERRQLLPEGQRPAGCGSVYTGTDGVVYGEAGGVCYRLRNGEATVVEKTARAERRPQALADGRVLLDDGKLHDWFQLRNPETGQTTDHHFTYRGAGSVVFVVGEGPRGLVFGGSAVPLSLWQYDPATGASEDFGNPTLTEGEIYSILPWGQDLYVCAYGSAYLSRYTPGKPWDFGTAPDKNPYGIGFVGDGHLRPRAMIAGPGNRIYIGSLPPYGQLGGALAVFDPQQNKVVENYRHLVKDQAPVALAWDKGHDWIIGGTSVWGGGGSTPTAKQLVLFAWDPRAKQKVWEISPVAGDENTQAACVVGDKAFFTTRTEQLVVVDTASGKVLHQTKIPYGFPLDISLAERGGLIYALTAKAIITVDPRTYEIRELAAIPGGANAGFAMTDTSLYFGAGIHLKRYRW